MTTYTHQTAPTRYVEANGIRFAYRRFGKAGGVPLVFNIHFTGTMDHWDPAVTDGFAKDREVILFDNAGISSSSGEVPTSIEAMAAGAAAFIKALRLSQVDVLGFSLGGLIAQELTLAEPKLVRRLVLVGTGPRSGEGMASLTPEAQQIFGATYAEPDHLWLSVFFTPSEKSQAAGREYLKRFRLRTKDRDPEVNETVAPAQIEALGKWGAPRENPYAYLKGIHQPTLVVNGGTDVIVYSVNSFILQQNLPNAQLILYPDANHGSQYQYPELFVSHVSTFLSDTGRAAASKSIKEPGPDHPITIERNNKRVVISVAGRVIADTRDALTLREATSPAVQYVPRKDVDMVLLVRTDNVTYCPYKGDCAYFSIPLGGERSINAVWTYEDPYTAVVSIKDHLAFYPDRVDSIEEIRHD
jgi:uncharacterized protein (DUF427 family)/pimeloyl-ACP methyl ester carboxylesterase